MAPSESYRCRQSLVITLSCDRMWSARLIRVATRLCDQAAADEAKAAAEAFVSIAVDWTKARRVEEGGESCADPWITIRVSLPSSPLYV